MKERAVSGRLVVVLAVLVVLFMLGAAWWFLRTDGAPPVGPRAGDAAMHPAPVITSGITTAPGDAATVQRSAAVRPVANEPSRTDATIRGRCVDEGGNAIARCEVTITGSVDGDARRDAWLRDHRELPRWNDFVVQSGDDGRFVATFWPPPPFSFRLRIARDTYSAVEIDWTTIAEAAVVDMGDVRLLRGVTVAGRVVDEAGAPVATVEVQVNREWTDETIRLPGNAGPATGARGVSDADGRFRCSELLAPGRYDVSVPPRYALRKPLRVVLDPAASNAEARTEEVVVVLRAPRPELSIVGKAVDAGVQPIAGVQVDAITYSCRATATTAADGTFSLQSGDADTSIDATIVVQHAALDAVRPPATVHWGTKDVLLTMQPAAMLALRVFDEQRQLLRDYAVRIASPDPNGHPARGPWTRARGPFADGVATVAIEPGKWIAVVEFPARERRATVFTPVEIVNNGTTQLDVIAPANVDRTVRVVGSDGAAIAGAAVQLCEAVVLPFTEKTRIVKSEAGWYAGARTALSLAEGRSGTDGRVVLAGPPGRSLALNLPGPGHVPHQTAPVVWSDAGELTIIVVVGARLHGKVGPPDALAAIARASGEAKHAPRGARISLLQSDGKTQRRLPASPDDERFTTAADGAFDIAGLPPGEWTVEVEHYERVAAGMSRVARSAVGKVVLRDGDVTRVDPDLSALLPGTITDTLKKNGRAFADAELSFLGKLAVGDGVSAQGRTDADGRFTQEVRAGEWRTSWWQKDAAGDPTGWPLGRAVTIVAGQTTHQELELWTGSLALTVADPDGNPVNGAEVRAVSDAPGSRAPLPRTDARGSTSTEATATTFRIQVLPRRMQSQEARKALLAEAQKKQQTWDEACAPHWIVLGTVAVPVGGRATAEYRLPREWER